MRVFAPASFGLNRPEFYAAAIEERLGHSGEYVRHISVDGSSQWVVMNYQYIPVSANVTGDYLVSGANPRLWGYIEHFESKPRLYREGDSVRPSSGSQFEIRGFTYNVKKVDINHVGYVSIELVIDKKCDAARPEFFEEQAALTCTTAPVCDDA